VARRWRSFDRETTNREFNALPFEDRKALFEAMKAYRMELGIGYLVNSYGGGLYRIKSSNRTQGRCLFFTQEERNGEVLLTALLAYKKVGNKAPKAQIETARRRMGEAKEE
jgi:phage-related protein